MKLCYGRVRSLRAHQCKRMLVVTKLLIVLAGASVALEAGAQRFRPHGRANGRIVGGGNATEGEIPWQVSIQTKEGVPQVYCGGSIISRLWILTAAHCSVEIEKEKFQLRVGSLNYNTGGQVHQILEIVFHEDYNYGRLHDIAVWKVTPPFSYGPTIGRVQLPTPFTDSPPGLMLTVSGWGTTSAGGHVSPTLLKVDVPIVDKEDCNIAYDGEVGVNQICAGYTAGGKDSCQGDSGGPLFHRLTQVTYGVVSWGRGCAFPNYPGVYTEVAKYRDWIKHNTGI